MLLRRRLPVLCLIALLLAPAGGGAAEAAQAVSDDLEPAARSAIYLMQRSVQVRRDGTHNQLLRSLRHLHDPLLDPLFTELAGSPHAALKIHGLLGLAELNPDRGLDLRRVAPVDDVVLQAELITAALDSDLLTDEQARQLLAWPGLDTGVRLLLAAHLLARDKLDDRSVLQAGLTSTRLARQGLAALLLHQLGDPEGTAALRQLDQRQGGQRDAVRAMLLSAALRHDLHRAGNWAYALATEPGGQTQLHLLALQTALRFGDPRAAEQWQQQFASTRDAAQRTRLALAALQVAPWLEPDVFETLSASDEELLAQVGRAGVAITAGGADVATQVGRLIDMQHPMSTAWALHYAATEAPPADARQILLRVIEAYDHAPDRQRVRRLDEAVRATQTLYELDPAAARDLLRPMLTRDGSDPLLVRAILLGLVRTQQGEPWQVIAGLADWPDADARRLALLLLAKHDQPLTAGQVRELGVLVQGGGGMQDSLRIQAGWAWLKRHDQTHVALAAVLGSM